MVQLFYLYLFRLIFIYTYTYNGQYYTHYLARDIWFGPTCFSHGRQKGSRKKNHLGSTENNTSRKRVIRVYSKDVVITYTKSLHIHIMPTAIICIFLY